MLGFQFLEPVHQLVVLEIGDFRRRLDVVFAIVIANFFAELFDFLGRSHDETILLPRRHRAAVLIFKGLWDEF